MKEEQIIKELAEEIAKRDTDSLAIRISSMSFEKAFKALDGFNLKADVQKTNGHVVGAVMRFDCKYKSIYATICDDGAGRCEICPTQMCRVVLSNDRVICVKL